MKIESIAYHLIFLFIFINQSLLAQTPSEPEAFFLNKVGIKIGTGIYWTNTVPKMSYLPDRSLTFNRSNNIGWQAMLAFELSERIEMNIGFRTAHGNFLSDSSVVPASAAQGERTLIEYDFRVWEVPLGLRYYLTTGKFRVYLDGAISFNKFSRFTFSKSRFAPWISSVEKSTTNEVSEVNWGYEAGPGLFLVLNNGIGISLDAKYQLIEYYWRFSSKEIMMNRIFLSIGAYLDLKKSHF